MKYISLAALLIAVAALGVCSQALACTCASRDTEAVYEKADVVFTGAVAHIDTTARLSVRVSLDVFKVWKGVESSTFTVYTSMTTCGIAFRIGAEYLIFAEFKDYLSRHETDVCDPTDVISQSAEYLEFLGEASWTSDNYLPWGSLKAAYR